jgi:hypothetical protein
MAIKELRLPSTGNPTTSAFAAIVGCRSLTYALNAAPEILVTKDTVVTAAHRLRDQPHLPQLKNRRQTLVN